MQNDIPPMGDDLAVSNNITSILIPKSDNLLEMNTIVIMPE